MTLQLRNFSFRLVLTIFNIVLTLSTHKCCHTVGALSQVIIVYNLIVLLLLTLKHNSRLLNLNKYCILISFILYRPIKLCYYCILCKQSTITIATHTMKVQTLLVKLKQYIDL